MAEQYANFATTLLNGAINNSTTSVVVDDGSVFPSTGNFRIVIDSEIMVCTSRSSNTLTVTRGQEGTTGASHVDDSVVKCPLTKQSLLNLLADGIEEGLFSALPSAGQEGRLYQVTDENVILRDSGSAWGPFGPIWKLYNPNDQSWSWGRDRDSANAVTNHGYSITLGPRASIGSGGVGFDARITAVPSVPWTVTALFQPHYTNAGYTQVGFGLYDNVNNLVNSIQYQCGMATSQAQLVATMGSTDISNWAGSGGTNVASYTSFARMPYIWLRLVDDNTNHKAFWSWDGITWTQLYTHARTTYMSAPTHVWWGNQLFGTGEHVGISLLSYQEH